MSMSTEALAVEATDHDNRAEFTAGLRGLADLLDENPDLPLPYDGRANGLTFLAVAGGHEESRRTARRFAELIPGKIDKVHRDNYLDLEGSIHGLRVQLIVYRDAVCTRRVVGTRQVTETVPDPDAPMVTVTTTVEDVEWDCEPILAASAS